MPRTAYEVCTCTMELNEKDKELLAEIARRPQLESQALAQAVGISQSSCVQRITKFREHSMVVKNHGSGAVKRCDMLTPAGESDVCYTEPYENEEFTWLLTGKGESALKEYRKELADRLATAEQSLKRRKVYRPSHVLDE